MTLLRNTLRWSLLGGLLLSIVAFAIWSWRGAAGSALGVAVADAEIAAMALLGSMLLGFQAGPRVIQVTLLFAVLKLPVVAVAVFLAVRLGADSLSCFLAGFALVYCQMVLVGLRQFRTQKRDLFS